MKIRETGAFESDDDDDEEEEARERARRVIREKELALQKEKQLQMQQAQELEQHVGGLMENEVGKEMGRATAEAASRRKAEEERQKKEAEEAKKKAQIKAIEDAKRQADAKALQLNLKTGVAGQVAQSYDDQLASLNEPAGQSAKEQPSKKKTEVAQPVDAAAEAQALLDEIPSSKKTKPASTNLNIDDKDHKRASSKSSAKGAADQKLSSSKPAQASSAAEQRRQLEETEAEVLALVQKKPGEDDKLKRQADSLGAKASK